MFLCCQFGFSSSEKKNAMYVQMSAMVTRTQNHVMPERDS